MTKDFITLLEDFLDYNKNIENPITIKEYLINILNYTEDTASEVSEMYGVLMSYS